MKRRRWKDDNGKSYSRDIGLCATGTRLSKEYSERNLVLASIKNRCDHLEKPGIEAFVSVPETVKDRTEDILYYFIDKSSNAFAESFNSKIKHFRAQLGGVSDVDFFLFRLSTIFS